MGRCGVPVARYRVATGRAVSCLGRDGGVEKAPQADDHGYPPEGWVQTALRRRGPPEGGGVPSRPGARAGTQPTGQGPTVGWVPAGGGEGSVAMPLSPDLPPRLE